MQQIKLIIRKILWHFSKKDLNAILKYDPLNVLKEGKWAVHIQYGIKFRLVSIKRQSVMALELTA
jgi:hypothetical protein